MRSGYHDLDDPARAPLTPTNCLRFILSGSYHFSSYRLLSSTNFFFPCALSHSCGPIFLFPFQRRRFRPGTFTVISTILGQITTMACGTIPWKIRLGVVSLCSLSVSIIWAGNYGRGMVPSSGIRMAQGERRGLSTKISERGGYEERGSWWRAWWEMWDP